jgi:hypothetical protein
VTVAASATSSRTTERSGGSNDDRDAAHFVSPFNGPVEIGLRALCVLTTAFPTEYALQRLVVFDYFLVHSDDIEGGPEGLHPRTPIAAARSSSDAA